MLIERNIESYIKTSQLINDCMMTYNVKELFEYGDSLKCVKLRI